MEAQGLLVKGGFLSIALVLPDAHVGEVDVVSERLALLCQRSVMTQCIHFTLRERYHRMGTAAGWKPGPLPLGLDIDVIAEHVFRFSLAAIRELRRQVEGGELDDGE